MLLRRLHREQGQTEAAEELLIGTVRQAPDFLFGWLELLRCRSAREAWTDVISLVEQAQACFGENHSLLLYQSLRARARA